MLLVQVGFVFGLGGGVFNLSPVIPETCLVTANLTASMETQYAFLDSIHLHSVNFHAT